MAAGAEARLRARSIEIEEAPAADLDAADEPDRLGCAVIWPVVVVNDGNREGVVIRVVARDDLTPQRRTRFAEWAEARIDRCLEHGTELDGWQVRSDGGVQAYCRQVWLPNLASESAEAAEAERLAEERIRRQ